MGYFARLRDLCLEYIFTSPPLLRFCYRLFPWSYFIPIAVFYFMQRLRICSAYLFLASTVRQHSPPYDTVAHIYYYLLYLSFLEFLYSSLATPTKNFPVLLPIRTTKICCTGALAPREVFIYISRWGDLFSNFPSLYPGVLIPGHHPYGIPAHPP
jgi:hypothetical protein